MSLEINFFFFFNQRGKKKNKDGHCIMTGYFILNLLGEIKISKFFFFLKDSRSIGTEVIVFSFNYLKIKICQLELLLRKYDFNVIFLAKSFYFSLKLIILFYKQQILCHDKNNCGKYAPSLQSQFFFSLKTTVRIKYMSWC